MRVLVSSINEEVLVFVTFCYDNLERGREGEGGSVVKLRNGIKENEIVIH